MKDDPHLAASTSSSSSSSTASKGLVSYLENLPTDQRLNLLSAAVIIVDTDTRVVLWNESATQLYGWETKDALGRPLEDLLVPEEQRVEFANLTNHLFSGKPWSGTFTTRTKRGDRLPVQISSSPIQNDAGDVVGAAGVSVDLSDRVKLERDLAARERFIQEVTDTSPMLMYLYDVKARRNVWMNRYNQNLLGTEAIEQSGTLQRRVHPSDVERLQKRVERLEHSSQPLTLDCEYRLEDEHNSYHWYLDRARVFDRDGRGRVQHILGCAVDITDQKEAEERIRHSEIRYRRLLENLPIGYAILERVEEPGKPVDYRHIDLNSAYERHTGFERKKSLGKTIREVVGEIDSAIYDLLDSVLNNHQEVNRQVYLAQVDKTFQVSAYTTEARRVAIFYMDISDQVRQQDELRRSEELMYRTGSIAGVGGWELDLESGQMTWTRTTAELHGVDANSLPLEDALRYLHDGDRERVRADLTRISEEKTEISVEARLQPAGGEGIWVRIVGAPMPGNDGDPRLIGGTIQNVTGERKRQEKERAYEEKLWQTQKLESLGVLAGGIAHDFNNLLVGILGNADLAAEDLEDGHPIRDYLKDISEAASRAADLSRQMLMFSGKASYNFSSLDLNGLLRQMTHIIQVSINRNIVLRVHPSDNLPEVHGDLDQLRQVLLNLVLNASEAIGERSGAITLSTGAMDCDREYLDTTFLPGNVPEGLYCYFEVADTGEGMSDDVLERIFDPFFSTRFTGRGLGLAAALGIVRSHQGAIKVYTEEGQGTTVKVLLPAMEAEQSKPSRPIQHDPDFKGTVLLADDEETVLGVTKRMLVRMGFDVLLAKDGQEAVDQVREHADTIDLILLDLTMPRLTGPEAFTEIRRISPSLPVILTSGYTKKDVVSRFAGKGLAGFLQKPFKLDKLRRAVFNVLAGNDIDDESGEGELS